MDYVYAVCAPSSIDGGAPGYFSLCFAKTKEAAEKMLDYLNTILMSDVSGSVEEIVSDSKFSFGYEEGIWWNYKHKSETLYIRKIPIISEASDGIAFFKEYVKERIDKRIQWMREYKEKERLREQEEACQKEEQLRLEIRINELIKLKNRQAMEELDDEN